MPRASTENQQFELGLRISSLALIAVGAGLTWAVDGSVARVDVNAVGVTLMVAGSLALLASLVLTARADGGRAGDTDPPPPDS
jgi:hypothetical protein